MDILIIIAIAAIAVLLTGLTDLRALRRPFRDRGDPDERAAGRESDADPPSTGERTSKKQQKRST